MRKKNNTNRKKIVLVGLLGFIVSFCTLWVISTITQSIVSNNSTKTQSTTVRTNLTPTTHLGLGPKCPQSTCFTLLVNGDLLFHEGLWSGFSVDKATNNGKNFDFTSLFAGEEPYFAKSNIKVCDFETPISVPDGPYAAYPIFSIPPEVADGAAALGYDACTTATNHAIDNGTEGIFRLLNKLDEVGIKHTGTNRSEADSKKPLILPVYDTKVGASGSPAKAETSSSADSNANTKQSAGKAEVNSAGTAYAKLGLVTGTVSLNGMVSDYDWRVDRLRDDDNADSDIKKMIAKAKSARSQGADVIAAAIHSVQEYIDYADDWQINTAHRLADSGEFNLIYSHGSHAVQPIEKYKNTWIIYGVGNSVTESADTPETVINNRGVTIRIQFAKKNDDKTAENSTNSPTNTAKQTGGDKTPSADALIQNWYIPNISWVPSFNVKDGKYAWCSLADDHPQGFCTSPDVDTNLNNLIADTIYAMGADKKIVTQWLVTKEK